MRFWDTPLKFSCTVCLIFIWNKVDIEELMLEIEFQRVFCT